MLAPDAQWHIAWFVIIGKCGRTEMLVAAKLEASCGTHRKSPYAETANGVEAKSGILQPPQSVPPRERKLCLALCSLLN